MDANQIAALFKQKGIRPTPQRIGVYQYLAENPVHASADTIYEALSAQYPSFSKTTVYNTIRALVDHGLVRTVSIEGEYIRYDANIMDHGHFKCTVCGQVYDFDAPLLAGSAPQPKGFRVERRDVFFYGLCAKCAEQVKSP